MKEKTTAAERNDIPGLAERIAFEPHHYQETRRAQVAQSAAARWPMLSAVRGIKDDGNAR